MHAPSVRLSRPLETQEMSFAGSVAIRCDQPAILLVLTAIVEHGGEITSQELGLHLLGVGRTAMADRLLNLGCELNLVRKFNEALWVLTERGEDAVSAGQVLSPEFGIWRIRVCEDALFGPIVLNLERAKDPNLERAIRGAAPAPANERSQSPAALDRFLGQLVTPVSAHNEPFLIEDVVSIEPTIERDEATEEELSLSLFWSPLEHIIEAVDTHDNVLIKRELSESPTLEHIFACCVGDFEWDEQTDKVIVGVGDLTDTQVMQGCHSLEIANLDIEIAPFGMCTYASFKDLDARPIDETDAFAWLHRRLEILIDVYATKSRWKAWLEKASAGIEPYLCRPLPSRDDFASDIELNDSNTSPNLYWFLHAAADWDV